MRMFWIIRVLILSLMFLVASDGYAQVSHNDTIKGIVFYEDTTFYEEVISYDEILAYKDIAFYEEVAFYAEKVREEWKIPGMSVSILKNDSVVFASGFGVRELESLVPVTENTVFHIGSITKSFTSWLIASLVEDKLISWNDKVKDILPDFDLYDDYLESNLLVKDLMTHNTGLRGQAGTYIPNLGYNRDDIYQMLKFIKPTNSFRGSFAYNNITFIIAAKIIESVSGKSWEENVEDKIFQPLEMTSSTIGSDAFLAEGSTASVAHSCSKIDEGIVVNPIYGKDRALHWCSTIGPAGSINSTVVDLAKWAGLHLEIASGDAPYEYRFLHRGHTIVKQNPSMIRLYGQCWYVEQNNEYKMYYHTGTTWGFTAMCAFIPQLDLAISILCNSETPTFPRFAIVRHIVDMYLGKTFEECEDRSAKNLASWLESKPRWKSRKNPAYSSIPPTHRRMVGVYKKDEPFGDARVSEENGKLYLTIGRYGWKHELKKVSGNMFSIDSDGHVFPIYFHMKKRGRVVSLEVDFQYNENFGVWKK